MAVDKEHDGGEAARGRPSPTIDPNQPKPRKARACRGILYYDSLLKLQSKDPICYGISETVPRVPRPGKSELEAYKENQSLQDFQYSCAGYSVHFSNNDSSNGLTNKTTELPSCIGLEIFMDNTDDKADHRDLDHKREGDLADSRQAKASTLPPAQCPPRATKPFPVPPPSLPRGDVYLDRFARNAKLVAASMKKNVRRVVNHIKQSIDDIRR